MSASRQPPEEVLSLHEEEYAVLNPAQGQSCRCCLDNLWEEFCDIIERGTKDRNGRFIGKNLPCTPCAMTLGDKAMTRCQHSDLTLEQCIRPEMRGRVKQMRQGQKTVMTLKQKLFVPQPPSSNLPAGWVPKKIGTPLPLHPNLLSDPIAYLDSLGTDQSYVSRAKANKRVFADPLLPGYKIKAPTNPLANNGHWKGPNGPKAVSARHPPAVTTGHSQAGGGGQDVLLPGQSVEISTTTTTRIYNNNAEPMSISKALAAMGLSQASSGTDDVLLKGQRVDITTTSTRTFNNNSEPMSISMTQSPNAASDKTTFPSDIPIDRKRKHSGSQFREPVTKVARFATSQGRTAKALENGRASNTNGNEGHWDDDDAVPGGVKLE